MKGLKEQQTLADIFLEVLSKNSDSETQDIVRQIKIILKIPECAEFFNVVLINAMGYKSNISKDTVDRAIDCVIDKNKLEIDRTDLNKNEKEQQKQNCESICHLAKNWMLDRLTAYRINRISTRYNIQTARNTNR